MTPQPSPILLISLEEKGKSMEKNKQKIKIESRSNRGMTYTNPSLPQSKGLEAESGEELYFVDNALNLHKIHGNWDKVLAGDTNKGENYISMSNSGQKPKHADKFCNFAYIFYEWLLVDAKVAFLLLTTPSHSAVSPNSLSKAFRPFSNHQKESTHSTILEDR